mmetsp:Transcript_15317/g.46380  ORF Transcript_15317/g.46380 Transcript_15317/m.46380 type:complete len:326 (+) Transcript_15317:1268-2245(+)
MTSSSAKGTSPASASSVGPREAAHSKGSSRLRLRLNTGRRLEAVTTRGWTCWWRCARRARRAWRAPRRRLRRSQTRLVRWRRGWRTCALASAPSSRPRRLRATPATGWWSPWRGSRRRSATPRSAAASWSWCGSIGRSRKGGAARSSKRPTPRSAPWWKLFATPNWPPRHSPATGKTPTCCAARTPRSPRRTSPSASRARSATSQRRRPPRRGLLNNNRKSGSWRNRWRRRCGPSTRSTGPTPRRPPPPSTSWAPSSQSAAPRRPPKGKATTGPTPCCSTRSATSWASAWTPTPCSAPWRSRTSWTPAASAPSIHETTRATTKVP